MATATEDMREAAAKAGTAAATPTAADNSPLGGFRRALGEFVRARMPIVQIVTYEEERALKVLQSIADELRYNLVLWSTTRGVFSPGESDKYPSSKFGGLDLTGALQIFDAKAQKKPKDSNGHLFVLLDPQAYLVEQGANPIYRRALRDFAINVRTRGYSANCVIVSPSVTMPLELEKEITLIDLPLPDRPLIKEVFERFVERIKESNLISVQPNHGLIDALVDASLGLTLQEIENILARAVVDDRKLDHADVQKVFQQKQNIIRKSGILDYYDTARLSTDLIGGLDTMKRWLEIRTAAFSDQGRDYGIATPKGVLVTGVPGCGKSLSAKCVAASWGMPLVKLDMGKIYSRWIGSSEEHMRDAIRACESIAPCVLWIDEIEKGLPRHGGHVGDSGVSLRVLGSFLTWLQEKTAPVFVFATANAIDLLPPEILRKGRFDEIFFVDLPLDEERRQILGIHVRKVGRDPGTFDLDRLVALSGESQFGEGIVLSGAEIESWVNEALIASFQRARADSGEPVLEMRDFQTVIERIVPIARLRRDEIQRMRVWASEHALSASGQPLSRQTEEFRIGGRQIHL